MIGTEMPTYHYGYLSVTEYMLRASSAGCRWIPHDEEQLEK